MALGMYGLFTYIFSPTDVHSRHMILNFLVKNVGWGPPKSLLEKETPVLHPSLTVAMFDHLVGSIWNLYCYLLGSNENFGG